MLLPPLRPVNGEKQTHLEEELVATGFFDWLRAAQEGW